MNSAIFFVPPLCALFDKNVFVFSVDVWILELHYIHSIYLHIYFYGIIVIILRSIETSSPQFYLQIINFFLSIYLFIFIYLIP